MYDIEDITDNIITGDARVYSVIHNMEVFSVMEENGKYRLMEHNETDEELAQEILKATKEWVYEKETKQQS